MTQNRRIVTIGGGTGSFTVLTGLKKYPYDISAIVAMSDDGGSSGRLRTKLGVLPPGDVRQALVALSQNEGLMLDVLKYRFQDGELKGHNLGNLVLSGLSKVTGDFEKAIEAASTIFNVQGKVIPVTVEQTHLQVTLDTGEQILGETTIDDEPPAHLKNAVVKDISLVPEARITDSAKKAIMDADVIVIGPGDFWGSIIANLVVRGVSDALKETKATIIFVLNLMTRFGQHNFKASDYLEWISNYSRVDLLLMNDAPLPEDIVRTYALDNEFPIVDDISKTSGTKCMRGDLLGEMQYYQDTADDIKRSLLRHDPDKLAQHIIKSIQHV